MANRSESETLLEIGVFRDSTGDHAAATKFRDTPAQCGAMSDVAIWRELTMRSILSLLVIVYLIGVGVELAPVVQGQWSSGSASDFASSIARALPDALTWPAKVYRSLTDKA
ncbi:hypothetical protein AB4037_08335 [Labrys sp. KB_33_2]|uniref:hypothetical protein n=1 Tax=unclassified Labrys (in: a-proteobacteria) TaxID=2688601 RepID=UPI003EBFCC47